MKRNHAFEQFDTNIDANIAKLKNILNVPANEDVIFRFYPAAGTRICVVYIEGMANEDRIGQLVLRALKPSNAKPSAGNAEEILKSMLEIPQFKTVSQFSEIIQPVLSGMSCIFIDGCNKALTLETRSFPHRSVEKPTNESVVYGPHEAFNENLRTNISLIRRYVQSAELISEKIKIGEAVPTTTAIIYLKGVAREECIAEVRRRLNDISAKTVMGAGAVQQLIEDHPFSPLPQILQTERPDRAASCIEDGQIAILVENSPYALIAPVTFFHLIHASDDSFLRWQYGSALRIVRMLGLLISLVLPALYIALTLYHAHLIPMPLLVSIAESRANVPFSIIAEVFFMEFSFYLLNEAGLRTPSQIGSAFGIVGALILGQAAVSASIISPILIIIIALTGLGNYVIPNYSLGVGIVLMRLFLIGLSSLMGLYGLVIGLFVLLLHAASLKSFGVDYLAPVAPPRRHNPDLLLRLPTWMQKHALFIAKKDSWMAQEDIGK